MRVFIRRSGAPLTEGVPGFFTIDGFHKVLLPNLPAATTQVASESWVLGKEAQIDPASPQVLTLQRDVIALYTDGLRQAVGRPAARPRHRADAQPAAGGAGPVHPGLAAVADARPAGRHHAAAHADAAAATAARCRRGGAGRGAGGGAAAAQAASGAAARLQGLFGQANGPPPEPPGKAIEDRYAALIAFVGKGPGAPIDNVLKLLNDLQVQLAKLAGGAGRRRGAALGGGDDPAQSLQAEASRDPQPVARWLQAMAVSGNQLRGGGAQRSGEEGFGAPGGPATLCSKAVAGRYPFTAGSSNDIPLDDFARCSRPAGCWTSSSTTTCRPSSTPRARPGRRSRWPASRRRSRRPISRSSSARRRSATCSSPPAAISRPCGSTSRRSTPTPSR